MHTVDLFLLGLILMSTLVGIWRGLVKEIMSLVIWIGAIWLAWRFSPELAPALTEWLGQPTLRLALAFAMIFLGTVIAGSLVVYLIGKLVDASGLTGTDRLLGAVFGTARGLVLVAALIIMVGLTSAREADWYQTSRVIEALDPLVRELTDALPFELVPRDGEGSDSEPDLTESGLR